MILTLKTFIPIQFINYLHFSLPYYNINLYFLNECGARKTLI